MLSELVLLIQIAGLSAQNTEQKTLVPIQYQYLDGNEDMRYNLWQLLTAAIIYYEKKGWNAYNNEDALRSWNRKVQEEEKTTQGPEMSTTVGKSQQRNDLTNSENNTILLTNDENYDRQLFNNETESKDDTEYNIGPSEEPSTTLRSEKTPIPDTHSQSDLIDSPDRMKNISDISTVKEVNFYNKSEETTTIAIEIDIRVAFSGDNCATGFVKVQGKCIKEQK